jgi:hypothetical protein
MLRFDYNCKRSRKLPVVVVVVMMMMMTSLPEA